MTDVIHPDLAQVSAGELHGLGLLEQIQAGTERVAELVAAGGAGARSWERLTWSSTKPYAGLSEGRAAKGFLLINDQPTDAYIALSSDRLNQAGALLTIPAGVWAALPIESSALWGGPVDQAAAGGLLVFVLDHAPAPAIGVFRPRAASVFKPIDAVAIGAEATIWTPAAGKRFRLMGAVLAASAACTVKLRDNTGGTVIRELLLAASTPLVLPFEGNGSLSAAAGNVLTATSSAAANLTGYVFGTEE